MKFTELAVRPSPREPFSGSLPCPRAPSVALARVAWSTVVHAPDPSPLGHVIAVDASDHAVPLQEVVHQVHACNRPVIP